MSPEQSGGPAELVLMALISRRYFIDGASKIDIAEQTGLSRFKVARLLDKARSLGLVKIDISYPGTIDVDASSRLQDALGLRHALVLDAVEDHHAALRADLGAAAAELLSEIVSADDVLGLAWARSVSAMSAAMKRLAPCTVVQMTGALPGPEVDESATELVRGTARTGGGPAYFFYAPMIVGSASMAQALRQQPEVARALSKLPSVTKAVVGVGSWDPPFSTLYDALEPAERESLHELGVRAEVSGILIDGDGVPLSTPLNDRMIGVDAAQLGRVPEVIAVAYDVTKSQAVLAAVRGGLVNSLITHRSLAEAMLRDAAENPVDRRPERIS